MGDDFEKQQKRAGDYFKSYRFLELYEAEEDIKKFQDDSHYISPSDLALKNFLIEYKTRIDQLAPTEYHYVMIFLSRIVKLIAPGSLKLSEKSMESLLNDVKENFDEQPIEEKSKSGRGTKIRDAYAAVPREPQPLAEFLEIHNVGENIMKQHKRFDPFGYKGKVRTRTIAGVKMIWRDPEDPDYLEGID